jgi:hypothetical protein
LARLCDCKAAGGVDQLRLADTAGKSFTHGTAQVGQVVGIGAVVFTHQTAELGGVYEPARRSCGTHNDYGLSEKSAPTT